MDRGPIGILRRLASGETLGGLLLLLATAVALGLANSPWGEAVERFWLTPGSIAVGDHVLTEPLRLWVNDGLMAIFFFVVGLEIKRELVSGELRDPRRAALPVAGAFGGMIAPAAIYLALEGGGPAASGWGIPMATDIAFAVGFLALLGARVPHVLKVFLLSLAIIDDLGAILVIAFFYSKGIAPGALGVAAGGLLVAWILNRLGVRHRIPYVLLGGLIWLATLKSGFHPTVAGVALAFVAPLEELEERLHPWVAFAIMPVFALANAGVVIDPSALGGVSRAVALGLVIGKPLGIVGVSWLATRTRLATLPGGIGWGALLGAGCLGGIGFTMSLFINGLALDGTLRDQGKIGTLAGSAVSAVLGCLVLAVALRRRAPAAVSASRV